MGILQLLSTIFRIFFFFKNRVQHEVNRFYFEVWNRTGRFRDLSEVESPGHLTGIGLSSLTNTGVATVMGPQTPPNRVELVTPYNFGSCCVVKPNDDYECVTVSFNLRILVSISVSCSVKNVVFIGAYNIYLIAALNLIGRTTHFCVVRRQRGSKQVCSVIITPWTPYLIDSSRQEGDRFQLRKAMLSVSCGQGRRHVIFLRRGGPRTGDNWEGEEVGGKYWSYWLSLKTLPMYFTEISLWNISVCLRR